MEKYIEEFLNQEPQKSVRLAKKETQILYKNEMIRQSKCLTNELRKLNEMISDIELSKLKEYDPMSLDADEGFDYKKGIDEILSFRDMLYRVFDYFESLENNE